MCIRDRPKDKFEELLSVMKEDRGVKLDSELGAEDLKELVGQFLSLIHILKVTAAISPDLTPNASTK